MGKLFGWILMLLAIYVGITLYTEGWDYAFGGILAPIGASEGDEEEARRGPN